MEKLFKSGYLCHPRQAYTLRRVTVAEGKDRGAQIIEVDTAVVHYDMRMEQIAKACGITVDEINRCDLPFENEFLNYFPGGLLYTGGLRSAGPANRDGGEWHPLHGRAHGLSAEQVCARLEGDAVVVSGVLRETALFGHALELRREYRIPVFGARIELRDRLTNLAHRREEYQLLYHCNFGWPLVSAEAHVELPEARKTTPRTPFAAAGLGRETTFTEPVPGEEERVFFHEAMEHRASIVNPAINTRMTITWSDTLPILCHWRSMASGDYVCGLEPSNSYIMGRADERKNGTLPALEPFGSIETGVTIEFE